MNDFLSNRKIRFILAGGINTIFGYIVGVSFYLLMHKYLGIILISVLANIPSISFSFCMHKYFVFRTRGGFWKEYFKSYLVYGYVVAVGIFVLKILVDYLDWSIYPAQVVAILASIFFSYIGHARFTFVKKY